MPSVPPADVVKKSTGPHFYRGGEVLETVPR